MKSFKINGKIYTAKEFDFNFMCELEESGISLDMIEEKPMSAMRAFFAKSADCSIDEAGVELGEHMANGGTFTDLLEAFTDSIEASGFFNRTKKKTSRGTSKPSQE